ncbi:hypothetical protein KAS24_06035 [Candidatus Bathyarchaeota archaeon]|nr:hypothetical protein [Candidatus Bathyarchaeota archaeon]
MVFEVIVPILVLIGGLVFLVFSSDTAVEHSVSIASAVGASPLIIGIVLVPTSTGRTPPQALSGEVLV